MDEDGRVGDLHEPDLGAAVSVDNLTHVYKGPNGPLTVVNDVSFEVPSGGYLALTGPSGAGKSTLLSLLGGLERPQDGKLSIGEHQLQSMNGKRLARYRSTVVGFVFQHFGLLESLTATENVELACTLGGMRIGKRRQRATELLNAVGLNERRNHRPLHMSGGERQRVAIARALANNPSLVLADEPTGNLDDKSAHTVIELLESVVQETGSTLIVVTHHEDIAARATQRLRLEQGRVVE